MASEKITMYRTNEDQTVVIEQLPKTITSQVYDHENEQFLDETVGQLSEHTKDDSDKKHIEVVSNIPNDLSESGILFKVDGTQADIPSMITVDEINNQVEQLSANINSVGVNAKSRGLIPDNTSVDNKEAFQQLFTAVDVDTIKIPEGVYTTSEIYAEIKNKVIKGVPGKTVIRSIDETTLQFGASEDVVFVDIIFESIGESWESIYGVLLALDVPLKRIQFVRCRFKSVKGNGVKFVNEKNYTSEDISFVDCVFQDIGRMGVEFQNHPDEGYPDIARYFNINFTNCIFNNIGTTLDDGMGISLSGLGQIANISNCTFTDCETIGVETIGAIYVTIDKCTFVGNTKGFSPISITNERPNDFITITNNNSMGVLGRINLYNNRHLIFTNNTFTGILDVYFRDAYNCKILNNIIMTKSSSTYALMFDNSGNNEIRGNTLDTSASTNNWSVLRFYEANSTGNKAYDNILRSGSGGATLDEMSGATGNTIGINHFGTEAVLGLDENALVPLDHSVTYWTSSNVPLVSEILVTFADINWKEIYELDIVCLGSISGSNNMFYTSTKIFGVFGSAGEFTKVDNTSPIGASIVATSISNTELKITCTTTVRSSVHYWVVKSSSIRAVNVEPLYPS